MSKELIIDKNTDIKKIPNKESYEKLIINCKTNSNKLQEFTNIKELTIDYEDKKNTNYNEFNINKLPFKEKLEKLIFKRINTYGEKKVFRDYLNYNLDFPNLKSIELPSYIRSIDSHYLYKLKNLEEIVFNIENGQIYMYDSILLYSDKLKRIIINDNKNEYEIIPEYNISRISNIENNFYGSKIFLKYNANRIETKVTIDREENTMENNNIWDIYAEFDAIYIPDNITELRGYETIDVKKISLNLKLLEHVENYNTFIKYGGLEPLETIELRSNNEMNLFPNKEIKVKDYGVLKKLYIKDNLLCLEYDACTLKINSKGEINKEDKVNEKTLDNIDLNKCTLEELELYVTYLKLLKLSNSMEYPNLKKVAENEIKKVLINKVINNGK